VTAPYVTSTFDYYSNAVGAHLAGTPLTEDYTEFLHLLGPDGQKVAQADGRPYDGQFSTDRWPVGPVIRDAHVISLGSCLPSGPYNLAVGFYVLKTMQRLGEPGHDTLVVPVDVARAPPVGSAGSLIRLLPAAIRLDHHLPGEQHTPC
jgi:hypothetical protein